MMNNKVTKVELKKVFKRSFMYGSSWNYERMQNLGFLYTILPVLKKLYPDKDSASPAMKRHLEFFNTHQTAAPFILGVTSAMEEQEGNEGAASITGIKVGLMGHWLV
ncbi:PTS system mannose/fructose/N -acetylgalactosamine-specific transporter subunit IID [Streptococcus pneumoniae]|nr:PTS system mannose/fructose/N -acetylgalactosamine-specific transporter subunit IID [Streptococcus pneumoniae]